MEKKRKLTPALFGFALVCFFMPFVSVSCQSQTLGSFTGIQLVTGTTVEQPTMFGPRQTQRVGGEPLALLAFLCGLAGLGLGFVKGRPGAVGAAAAGGLGVLLFLLLKSKVDGDVMSQGRGLLQLDWGAGFWLSLLCYLAAAFISVYALKQSRSEQAAPPPPAPV